MVTTGFKLRGALKLIMLLFLHSFTNDICKFTQVSVIILLIDCIELKVLVSLKEGSTRPRPKKLPSKCRPMQNCAIVLSTHIARLIYWNLKLSSQRQQQKRGERRRRRIRLLSPIFSTIFTLQFVPRPMTLLSAFFCETKNVVYEAISRIITCLGGLGGKPYIAIDCIYTPRAVVKSGFYFLPCN